MVLLVVEWGVAKPEDGFEPVKNANNCAIFMRARSSPLGSAMRAECLWPEVDPVVLTRMLGEYERYPEYVFAIDAAELRGKRADGAALIYQRQEMFGISDREVLLWMRAETCDGGTRFRWRAATEEPLALRRGAIRTPRNEGFWEVTSAPKGGTRVVHEVAVEAGGSIPRWLINLVRTRGFARVMRDVRRIAGDAE